MVAYTPAIDIESHSLAMSIFSIKEKPAYVSHRPSTTTETIFYPIVRDLILKELSDIKSYSFNWDGYEGIPAEPESLNNSYLFINELDLVNLVEPEISLNPNGTISFYWDNEFGKLSVEVGNDKFEGFHIDKSKPTNVEFFSNSVNPENLKHDIGNKLNAFKDTTLQFKNTFYLVNGNGATGSNDRGRLYRSI